MTATTQLIKINLPDVRQEVTLAGEWFAKRDQALVESAKITEVNADSANEAGGKISELGKMASAIENQRKEITSPFLRAQRTIKAVVDKAKQPLEDEVTRLKSLVAAFAEAERKRLAEEARKAEEERLAKEAAEAERMRFEREVLGQVTEVITIEEEPQVPTAPKFDGVRLSEAVVFEVINPEEIPTAFMTFDERKLRAWIAERKDQLLEAIKSEGFKQPISGIELKIDSRVAVR